MVFIERSLKYLSGVLEGILKAIPEDNKALVTLLVYTLFIIMYSVFIWKFHKLLYDKQIIKLDLNKYNQSKLARTKKTIAIIIHTLEVLILLPILVLFWFVVFSVFLLILSNIESANQVIMTASAILISIRIMSYIDINLSKSLARIVPFTILVFFLMTPGFFELELFIRKIIQLPSLINSMIVFMAVIFVVELVLRVGDSSSEIMMIMVNRPKKKVTKEEIIREINKDKENIQKADPIIDKEQKINEKPESNKE